MSTGSTQSPSPFTAIFNAQPGCNVGFAVQRHKDMEFFDFAQGIFVPTTPNQNALFSLANPVSKGIPGAYMACIPNANLAQFTDGYYFIYWCLTRESNQLLGISTLYIKDGTDVPH